jgi:TrmH RNA methyltransferase
MPIRFSGIKLYGARRMYYIHPMDHARVYGINACHTCIQFRKEKIVRAFFSKKIAPRFSELMKYLASQKKVYRIVDDEELIKISQSQHNEGVCFIVEKKPAISHKAWLTLEKKTPNLTILENVGNPHNLGSILRVCAHFGVTNLALNEAKAAQSGAAFRVAEGGGEFVEIIEYEHLKDFLLVLKKRGYKILTTSSHEGIDLYNYKFNEPYALLFGEESRGLSDIAFKMSDVSLKIPGTGHVESLNVSTALTAILGEIYRQNHF